MHKEARYEQLLNAISEYAVLLLDISGRIEFANTGAVRMFGKLKENALMAEVCPLESPDPFEAEDSLRKAAAKLKSTESFGIRLRTDGEKVWIHAIYEPILTGKKLTGFSVVLRDLSERRLAEAKYKSLLDTAPDAILLLDQTGKINLINEKVTELFNYPRHEILGMHADKLFPNHEANAGIWAKLADSESVDNSGIAVQALGKRADHTTFPAEINFRMIKEVSGDFISCSVRDVTNRNKLYDELTLANHNQKLLYKWLQGIIDSTPNLIVAVDTNLRLIAFNKSYAVFLKRFMGVDLKEGTQLKEIVSNVPEEFRDFFCRLQSGGFRTRVRNRI